MSNNGKCYCSDRHIMIVTRHSVSRITSGLALGAFFVFITGYFIGKRHLFHDEVESQELVIFDQRIQHALNEKSQMLESSLDQLSQNIPNENETKDIKNDFVQEQYPLITADIQNTKKNNVYYVALLSGYGTQKSAQQFVQRLEKKGIKAEVKTRVSINSQKKQRTWYQVVTEKYDNKQDLLALVDQLKDQEHLGNDVRIVEIA